MSHNKPWYLSKTIWASIAAFVSSLAGFFGMPFSEHGQDELAGAFLQLAAGVAAVIALYGRLVATTHLDISGRG